MRIEILAMIIRTEIDLNNVFIGTYGTNFLDHELLCCLEKAFSAISRRPLRILSIGCSDGREPYSIAMLAQKQGIDVSITAIDRNPYVLRKAQKGYMKPRKRSSLALQHRGCWTINDSSAASANTIRCLILR